MAAEFSRDRAISEKAAMLLTRRDEGWTADEAAEFALWRAADPRHEAAVRRLEATQRLFERLPETILTASLHAELAELERSSRRPRRSSPWLKLTGTLAAAASVALIVWLMVPHVRSTVSFATAATEHRTIDLTDGSTLLMNTGSEIDVDYRPQERRVNLRHGEVHFSVAKSTERPFVVAVGAVQVRAVGTAFNIRRESAAVEVIVTEGKVRVSREVDALATEPLYLAAGEAARIEVDATHPLPGAGSLAPEAMREKLAWQAPRLKFDNTPLSEVVTQFNRYSRVQLAIADPELAARPVGGTFNADNAEAFVGLLLTSGDVRVERVSETHLVLRKAR